MKYYFRVLLVALVCAAVVLGFSYRYREQKNEEKIELTTAHVQQQKEKESTTRTTPRALIAENKEADFQIYTEYNTVVFRYKGVESKRDGFNWNVTMEEPQIFYKDYNDDGKKDLLVKLVAGYTGIESDPYSYMLMVFHIDKDANGNDVLNNDFAYKDNWKSTFESQVRIEVNQLKNERFLQIVMDDINEDFKYDKDTGISSNKHVYYVSALRNDDGTYKKYHLWNKGEGIYRADKDGNISLDIQVLAYYNGSDEPQCIGNIHTSIGYKDNKFFVTPKTITFDTSDDYACPDPRLSAEKDWSCTVLNTYTEGTATDNVIDWIETDFSIAGRKEKDEASFKELPSQIKCLYSIEFTQDEIILTSKENYSFLHTNIDKKRWAAEITITNNGKKLLYNVAQDCRIEQVGTQQKLIFTLDKRYTKDELETVKFSFGI